MNKRIKPPFIAEWLLRKFLQSEDRSHRIGDFEEIYKHIADESGKIAANRWYWLQLIRSFPDLFYYLICMRLAMFKNYFKIAFRNLKMRKGYSFINIFGLALGLACCILILLWVSEELSYDRFHKNSRDIYRVVEEIQFTNGAKEYYGITPGLLGPALKETFPEFIKMTRFLKGNKLLVRGGEKEFYEQDIALADPSMFDLFDFEFIKGDPLKVLDDPFSIVITERIAQKYFNSNDVIGKVINLASTGDFQISGVLKNVPRNSHLKFDLLIPITQERRIGIPQSQVLLYSTYVQLNPNTAAKVMNEIIRDSFHKFAPEAPAKVILSLQPLSDIHLFSQFDQDLAGHGDISYVIIFSIIAGFILLIACVNFMNLSTARSCKRAKEVGMRKVLGDQRSGLIKQFYCESFVLCLLAMIVALFLIWGLLPFFNQLSGKELSLFSSGNWIVYIGILAMTIITALISGSYPALFLSSFQPIKVLKGRAQNSRQAASFRKLLVIFQYTLSIGLISATLIVSQQLNFMRNKKLGFNKEQILYLQLKDETKSSVSVLKNVLAQHTDIKAISAISELPTHIERGTDYLDWDGKQPKDNILMRLLGVDFDALDVFQFQMIDGRFFSAKLPTDISDAYIINQTAAKAMGMTSPIGQRFSMWQREGRIIGIVKDFHFRSLHQKIEPLIIRLLPNWSNYLCLKVSSHNISNTLNFIENQWSNVFPNQGFEYHFLNQSYSNLYLNEQRVSKILNYFTFLAVFISCLGLYGLASFMAEQRTREIGIRKVLGSNISGIVILLTKDFIKWVIFASFIAIPLAWFAMNLWLQDYPYRIHISVWTFVLSIGLALLVALFTVSYQSIRAATLNPVNSLKYE